MSAEPKPSPFDNAELYDLIFTGFDYGLDFYLEQARAAQGPVLDLACGTGRVLLPLLQAGVDADGADYSPAMLERARQKAEAVGYHPALYRGPMRNLKTLRKYALVVIPFNSFVHNTTQADQLATLRACREHLLPDGKLVFDVFYPGPELIMGATDEPVLELEISHPETGLPVQMWDKRTMHLVEQIQTSEMELRELDAERSVVRVHPSYTEIRWIFKPELELLLHIAGFSRWEIARAFDFAPLTGATEPMLVTAQKTA